MKTHLIRIGNSQGSRIPRPLLDQVRLHGELEIRADEGALIIQSARKPREGWAEAFNAMAAHGDDVLLDDVSGQSSWDEIEWHW